MTKYVIMTYFVTKYSVQRQRVWPTSYLPAPRLHKPSTLQDMKVLFFEIICDLGLIDTVPPWYSPIKPQSVYETAEVQAYWDVPVYRSTKSSEQIKWTLGSLTTERSKW